MGILVLPALVSFLWVLLSIEKLGEAFRSRSVSGIAKSLALITMSIAALAATVFLILNEQQH